MPRSSLLLVRMSWGKEKPSFFYIPLHVQQQILQNIGIELFLNLPKLDTNPRGVTFNDKALNLMENHPETKRLSICWKKENIEFNLYKKWVDYWNDL
jgi:hypothetical protein